MYKNIRQLVKALNFIQKKEHSEEKLKPLSTVTINYASA